MVQPELESSWQCMSQVELYDVIRSCTEECLSHTCAECSLKESRCSRMGNNSLSALLWKGKRDEVKTTPQSWAEQRGTGRLQFLAYISQICLLVVRMSLVLSKILLNLHFIYRTVLFSFDLFSKVLSGGRSQNTSPHHWRTLSLRFYHFNYTESISLMISITETWRAKSGGFSAFLLRF